VADVYSRSGIKTLPEVTSIAQKVRATRRKYGMTQAQVAGLSGTGLRFVSELERGKPTVALDKVLAVLSVLGLRLEVTGDDA
jgi:y4mF family transcriptional regulator